MTPACTGKTPDELDDIGLHWKRRTDWMTPACAGKVPGRLNLSACSGKGAERADFVSPYPKVPDELGPTL